MERYHNYQKRQKKKAPKSAPDRKVIKRIKNHIKELGLKDIPTYLKWCKWHHFKTTIEKNQGELWDEKRLHRSLVSDESLKKRRKVKNLPKLILQMSEGKLKVQSRDAHIIVLLDRHIKSGASYNCELKNNFLYHVAAHSRLLQDEDYINPIATLVKFKGNWVRPYQAWKPDSRNIDKQFSSLVHHLFAFYPVPDFVTRQLLGSEKLAKKVVKLFIHLGQGNNLRTYNGLNLTITKKMAHFFMQAPGDNTIRGAIRWGQTCALGGNKQLADAVSGSLSHFSFTKDGFWLSVIRFFVAHPSLKSKDFGPVVDYIYAVKYESHRVIQPGGIIADIGPEKPGFSMKGRNPKSLMKQVEKWHRQMQKTSRYRHLKWGNSGYSATNIEQGRKNTVSHKVWRFVELLSGKELMAEGRAQNHCVASYARACATGNASIWALYCNQSRTVTIEVLPTHKRIVQIRGKNNRLATEKEKKIIRQWAGLNGLFLASWA